jgi:hypothetical protein
LPDDAEDITADVTDTMIEVSLARTLIDAGYDPVNLPTDQATLYTWFTRLRRDDRTELANLIARRANTTSWPDWVERTVTEFEHADQIDTLRLQLSAYLDELNQAYRVVQSTHAALVTAYDLDYTEGAAARLFTHWIAQTGITIDTLIAVNPHSDYNDDDE